MDERRTSAQLLVAANLKIVINYILAFVKEAVGRGCLLEPGRRAPRCLSRLRSRASSHIISNRVSRIQ